MSTVYTYNWPFDESLPGTRGMKVVVLHVLWLAGDTLHPRFSARKRFTKDQESNSKLSKTEATTPVGQHDEQKFRRLQRKKPHGRNGKQKTRETPQAGTDFRSNVQDAGQIPHAPQSKIYTAPWLQSRRIKAHLQTITLEKDVLHSTIAA